MRRFLAAFLLAALFGNAGAFAQNAPPNASAEPALMMVRVQVADMAKSEHFYNEMFGMKVGNAVSPREHILRFSGADLSAPGLMLLLASEAPHNGGYLVQVPDIDATFSRVAAAGGVVVRAPRDTPSGVRSGVITDPDGTSIEVMQYIHH